MIEMPSDPSYYSVISLLFLCFHCYVKLFLYILLVVLLIHVLIHFSHVIITFIIVQFFVKHFFLSSSEILHRPNKIDSDITMTDFTPALIRDQSLQPCRCFGLTLLTANFSPKNCISFISLTIARF